MEPEKSNNKIGNFFHWFLTRSFFKVPVNVLSHGATHLIVLILVGIITCYMYFNNKKEVVHPHTIDVHLGRISDYNAKYKDKIPQIPLDNVSIKLVLNNSNYLDHTNGQFSSGLEVSFDGLPHYRHIIWDEKEEQNSTEEILLDSVVLSVISNPQIDNFSSGAYLDTIAGEKIVIHNDSMGRKVKERNIYKVPNTELQYTTQIEEDSAIVLFIAQESPNTTDSIVRFIHKAYLFSDELGVKENDPYYYYYIAFNNVNIAGNLNIVFDISGTGGGDVDMIRHYKGKNLQYNYVYPEPDRIWNGKIEYFTEEKKQQIIKNKGVIIQAVDIDAMNKRTNWIFLISVLFGTGVAFCLDILIQLVRELRREQYKNM